MEISVLRDGPSAEECEGKGLYSLMKFIFFGGARDVCASKNRLS